MSGMTWKEYMEHTEQYAQQFPQHITNKRSYHMPTATKEKAEPRSRTVRPIGKNDTRQVKLFRPTRHNIRMDWPCGDKFTLSISKLEKLFAALDQIKRIKSPLTLGVNLKGIQPPDTYPGLDYYWIHTKGTSLHITSEGGTLAEFSYAQLRNAIDQVKNDPIGEPNE